MFALALVPTVSHALAAASGQNNWTEVCTPQGMRFIAMSGTAGLDEPVPIGAEAAIEHCSYCAQSAGHLGMPPAEPGAAPTPHADDALPALFLHAPRTLPVWRSAQPRAPPVVS